MTSAAPAASRWFFGPAPDLLLGCGLCYFGLVALLALPPVAAPFQSWAGLAIPLLALLVNGPHYGATLMRVYQTRAERRKYALFAVWLTALLAGLLVWGVRDYRVGSLLLTAYVTWSPWHFSGQNYGLAVMFLRRRGIALPPAVKRALYTSFWLSFALAFLALHGPPASLSIAPVPALDARHIRFLTLGLPGAFAVPALGVCAAAYLATLGGVVVWLARARRLGDAAPALLLAGVQAAWFSVPAVLALRGGFSSDYLALAAFWIAICHSVQYLWVTCYYELRSGGAGSKNGFLLRALAWGALAVVLPTFLLAPGLLGGDLSYAAGLSTVSFAVVNLHHFVLDGAIWKLRDGRLARVLLRAGEAPAAAGPEPIGPRRWTLGIVYAVGFAALAAGLVSEWEAWFGGRAVAEGRLDRAASAVARLEALRRDEAVHHLGLARALGARGGDAELIRRHVERALEIEESLATWATLGQLHAFGGRPREAIAAFERALAHDPEDVAVLTGLADALLKARRIEDAAAVTERAAAVAPDAPAVRALRGRLAALAPRPGGGRPGGGPGGD